MASDADPLRPVVVVADEDLDLTNSHLHSLAEVPLKPTLKTLDLTANRLKHLEPPLLALEHLTWMCLRQNLLSDPTEVSALCSAPSLRHLELRDNQFSDAPDLQTFTALTYLELSYNEIRSLAPLATLHAPGLVELYAAQNKIPAIEGVSQLTSLEVLELGSNRIRAIEGLESLTLLRELWLGRNRITAISGLETLTSLRRISLQSNRLASMSGLAACTALEELYLSHNGIEEIEGLEGMANLKILDVSNNLLRSLSGVENLTQLTDLWANDNSIENLDSVEATLRPLASTLETVYLRGNPAAADPKYKLRVLYLLPKLQQLDDNPVERRIGSWPAAARARAVSTLAGLGTAAAAPQEPSQGCTTRSRAAAAAATESKKRPRVEKPMPDQLVLRCHRAGKPTGSGKRKSKRCGCTFKVVLSVVRDEDGNVEAFQYTEIGEHVGHVPGDERDRQWLPKDGQNDGKPLMVADEEESDESSDDEGDHEAGGESGM